MDKSYVFSAKTKNYTHAKEIERLIQGTIKISELEKEHRNTIYSLDIQTLTENV